MTDLERLRAVAEWLGMSWTAEQERRFLRFAEFLSSEGVAGGGVGPHEAPRMMDRHICDSLMYLIAIEPYQSSVIDVGSGLGLPAIPIAIGRPDLDVTLLDRSQRRTDLARRAVRILGLDNVTVETGDVKGAKRSWDVVTFRASLDLDGATEAFEALAATTGIGIFGVSRLPDRPSVPESPPGISYELHEEASEVLDSPSWLLRMRHL
jgi:16S rRNA (guanine(527)-N(7))-methyltransferase RsmG